MSYLEIKKKELEKKIRDVEDDILSLQEEKSYLEERISELKEVEISEVSTKFNTNDINIIVDEESVNNLNSWIAEHESLYHKEYLFEPKKGNAPIYNMNMGWTPLGRYITFTCEKCRKKFEGSKEHSYIDYEYNIEELC